MSIHNEIKSILSEQGIHVRTEDENDDLRIHGLDSLQIVLLLGAIEKKFSIKIELQNFKEEDFYLIESIVQLVNSHLE